MAFHRININDEIIAAMQADRDQGMSIAKIARKYGYSETVVHSRTKPRDIPVVLEQKSYGMPATFYAEWNAARCKLWGIRPGWYKEWNEARTIILAAMNIKVAKDAPV